MKKLLKTLQNLLNIYIRKKVELFIVVQLNKAKLNSIVFSFFVQRKLLKN